MLQSTIVMIVVFFKYFFVEFVKWEVSRLDKSTKNIFRLRNNKLQFCKITEQLNCNNA